MRRLRAPNGQFMVLGSAIAVWLPVLMDEIGHWCNPPVELCLRGAKWCECKAAENLREAANQIENAEVGTRDGHSMKVSADRWMQRAKVLIETAERLRQI